MWCAPQVPGVKPAEFQKMLLHNLQASGDVAALSSCSAKELANYCSPKVVVKMVPGKG